MWAVDQIPDLMSSQNRGSGDRGEDVVSMRPSHLKHGTLAYFA